LLEDLLTNYNKKKKKMAFCDSHLFTIRDDGVPLHKREGETYADKTINGVSLDDTIFWENEMWHHVPGEDPGLSTVVGDRRVPNDIQETTKSSKESRGEGKFYREKKIPSKKKKYPTKPKHSWHKRLSKVANELGDLQMHTEEQAWSELDDAHYEIHMAKEWKKKKEVDAYWSLWKDKVDKNPGSYSLVQLDVSVKGWDLFGGGYSGPVAAYRITGGSGVNLEHTDPHGFISPDNVDPDYENKVSGISPFSCNSRRFLYYYFTYWDEESSSYKFMNMDSWWRIFEHDPFEDFETFKEIFKMPTPNKNDDGYYYHWDDLDWKNVWTYMDHIRTGVERSYTYYRYTDGRLPPYPRISFSENH